jgi:hypothetical protein
MTCRSRILADTTFDIRLTQNRSLMEITVTDGESIVTSTTFFLVAEEVDSFLEVLALMRLEMVTEPGSPKMELRKRNGQIG